MLLLAVATVSDLMGAGVSAAPMMSGDDADDAAAAFNDEEGEALEAAQEAPNAAQAEAAALLGGTSSQTAPAQAMARRTRVEAGYARTGRGRSKGHQIKRKGSRNTHT